MLYSKIIVHCDLKSDNVTLAFDPKRKLDEGLPVFAIPDTHQYLKIESLKMTDGN